VGAVTAPSACSALASRRRLVALLTLGLALAAIDPLAPSFASAQTKADDDVFAELDRIAGAADDEQDEAEPDEGDPDEGERGAGDDQAAEGGSPAGDQIETMVVTGQSHAGSAQSIPEAITEFDQGALDRMNIADVESLALNTPSLHVGNFGSQPVITLRGIGAANLTTLGTPGVGFTMDGIHYGRPTAAAVRIYDVEDVRVYRGPQGVDGGYMTNGGRIAIQSMRPGEDLDFMGDIQYGAYDQILVRGALNVPVLPDQLLTTRATVTFETRDGYQRNATYDVRNLDADDADALITRFQTRTLLFDDSLEVRMIGGYNYQRGIGPARHALNALLTNAEDILAPPPPGDPPLPPDVARLRIEDCPDGTPEVCRSGDPRVTYADDVGYQDNSQANVTGNALWELPVFENSEWLSDLRVSLVGGWVSTSRNSRLDLDGTNSPHSYFEGRTDADQGSVELFFERPDVERFDFKTGGYFFEEHVDTTQCVDADSTSPEADVYTEQALLNRSLAWYGNVGYRMFQQLRLSGGLRYSNEYKDVDQYNARYTKQFLSGRANDTPCSTYYQEFLERPTEISYISVNQNTGEFTQADDITFKKWTYMAGLEWEMHDTSVVAFDFTTGYKPGGFTLGTNPGLVSRNSTPYGAEEVIQYQVTSKNTLFDSKLEANLTLFWTEYDPFQVCQIIGAQFQCNSRGQATSRGVELEVFAAPVDGLTLNGHFNFLDAKVRDLYLRDPTVIPPGRTEPTTSGGPFEDLSGNSLEKAPRFAGSFGVQYDWDWERWGVLSPRVQMQAQSRTYYRTFNREEFSQAPFAKLDLSLEWRSEDDVFVVRGFVDNVTDVDVINFLFIGPPSIGGPTLGFYLPPRTWGVRIGVTTLPDWL
jgi:iron complex outermembrane receptor protein